MSFRLSISLSLFLCVFLSLCQIEWEYLLELNNVWREKCLLCNHAQLLIGHWTSLQHLTHTAVTEGQFHIFSIWKQIFWTIEKHVQICRCKAKLGVSFLKLALNYCAWRINCWLLFFWWRRWAPKNVSGAQLLQQKKKSKSWVTGAIVECKCQEIDPWGGFHKPIYALRLTFTPKKASQKFGAERKSLV